LGDFIRGNIMIRALNWAALGLGLLTFFTGTMARGDDAPSTQPSPPANCSITVTVVDAGSKAVQGVNLSLREKKTKAASGTAKKGKALATGTTDADGKYTFANIEPGDYRITATLEGVGHGNAKVSVTEDAPNATANVTLKPYKTPAAGGGQNPTGPTTAPSPGV
jgi:hypothetical protein